MSSANINSKFKLMNNGSSSDESNNASFVLNQNQTQKAIKEALYNGTGFYIEDENETGFNDIQTLFLACVATLVPLIVALITAFAIRILWTKYKKRKESAQFDANPDVASDLRSAGRPLHAHLLNDKLSDSNVVIGTEEVQVCDSHHLGGNDGKNNCHSNTNGSIITMTLKNNHLIVETEERNDIEEESKETTMKYSPGARNGVFVVEVQQGIRRSPGAGSSSSSTNTCIPNTASTAPLAEPLELQDNHLSDQCAIVHSPPEKFIEDPIIATTPILSKTGLTQSNSSLTASYSHSNQQGYDIGTYGYPVYNGYLNEDPVRHQAPPSARPHNDKPKIMSAVYKKNFSFDLFNGNNEEPKLDDNLQNYISNLLPTKQVERAVEAEPEVGSVDCENEGFECANNNDVEN